MRRTSRLPLATAKLLSGAVELRQFATAGLVRAFDLSRQLAGDVCTAPPPPTGKRACTNRAPRRASWPRAWCRTPSSASATTSGRQNKLLLQTIDTHAPQGSKAGLMLPVLSTVPATLRAAADLSSLFKTDAGADAAKGHEKKELAALAAADGSRA